MDNERCGPYIYNQVFFAPADTWRGLEGTTFDCVPSASPDEPEGPCICIHEHDDIQHAAFSFGKRDGARFKFHLTGKYLWFEMTPDPIHLETWMDFTGAVTYASNLEQAWKQVTQHLNGHHLRPESDTPVDMTNGRFQFRFRPLIDG